MSRINPNYQNEPRTAAELALMLSLPGAPVSRQAVNKRLAKVPASVIIQVRGNATKAWHRHDLPVDFAADLENAVKAHKYRDLETLWQRPPGGLIRDESTPACPAANWSPGPRSEIASDEWLHAARLRDVLLPALANLHDASSSSEELHSGIVERYETAFGHAITADYARKLLARTLAHDGGREDWLRADIYLPDSPRRRAATPPPVNAEQAEPEFPHLSTVLKALCDPAAPGKPMVQTIWTAACRDLSAILGDTEPGPDLVRQVCDLLFEHAPHLCRKRSAYPRQLNRKYRRWLERNGDTHALKDLRANNGERVEIPQADIDLLRHATAFLHSGNLDTAWWEEYDRLSQETRNHYRRSWRCPTKIRELVNGAVTTALTDFHNDPRKLKQKLGSVKRRWDAMPSMHSAAMDDCTLSIEVEHPDGSGSLILPQVVITQDRRSRKIIGDAVAPVAGPNAELVCAAALDAFERHGVPRNLCLENGQVFGKSLLVNGKQDEQGRTVVCGLEAYGCKIRHFEPGSPTSKGELEKTFDFLQKRLERHPGYTGRMQRIDAPQAFKIEGLHIRSGRAPAQRYRYTWEEFTKLLHEIIAQYNAKPQRGELKGLSPDQAFEKFKDASHPPIFFAPELHWMVANSRARVEVKAGGVRFPHNGRQITVRGEPLPRFIGQELWAVVDRRDDSLVTFMRMDFSETFTMEICQDVHADEASAAPGSGTLAAERRKLSEHFRAIKTEYQRLEAQFGNPRETLLQERREQNEAAQQTENGGRRVGTPRPMVEAGEIMEEQRSAIRQRRASQASVKDSARRHGEALERRARELYEQETGL